MLEIRARITDNMKIGESYFRLSLLAPEITPKAHPGQFVNIRLRDVYEPLLRRPFSIHRAHGKIIEIMYEALGRGTEILSRKKPGAYLDIIGPLGNGFLYQAPSTKHQAPILIAGGMGVAPLLFLAERLVHSPQSTVHRKLSILIGARTKTQVLCEKEFAQLGCAVKIATDDGSRGFKGKVTELLKRFLRDNEITRRRATIYACGPRPMLQDISAISKSYQLPAQISLEEHMACGFGVCLGCVVKARSPACPAGRQKPKAKTEFEYKRVCKEGPVFKADEIAWEQ